MLRNVVEQNFAKRFRLSRSPTVLSQRGAAAPIAISRLCSDDALDGPTRAMPSEDAYTFQIAIGPMPPSEIWIDGKYGKIPHTAGGDTFVFDLAARPVAHLRKPYDFLRFYLPTDTLKQLAYEEGVTQVGGLRTTAVGLHNSVMYGLALAILPSLDQPECASALFVDSIALAFHAHVIHTYARTGGERARRGFELAPWQIRRVCDYIEANLHLDPSTAELAKLCNLSIRHFGRAFRETVGVPPHRWLIIRRIERAKSLLRKGTLPLVEIAQVCGFVDQSHLSRVFAAHVGSPPARWRRDANCRPMSAG